MKRKQLLGLVLALALIISAVPAAMAEPIIETVTHEDGSKTVTIKNEDGSIETDEYYPSGELKAEKTEWSDGSFDLNEYDKDGNNLSQYHKWSDGQELLITFVDGKYSSKERTLADGYKTIEKFNENGSVTYDADGKVVGELKWLENGDTETWYTDHITGYVEHRIFLPGGPDKEKTTISPFGHKEKKVYDESYWYYVTTDENNDVIAEFKKLEDGTSIEWDLDSEGNRWETHYGAEDPEQILEQSLTYDDGYKEITKFYEDDGFYTITTDSDGKVIGESKNLEDGTHVTWKIYRDGGKLETVRDKEGNETYTFTKADGKKEITTYDDNNNSVTKDENGNILSTRTEEKEGYWATRDADGKLIGEEYDGKYGVISSWFIDDKGNKIVYKQDAKAKKATQQIFDPDGNLIEENLFDLEGKPVPKKTFEEAAKPKFVWYPHNTASTHGFAFRDERPELTDKWYRFTPLDLSHDGTISIPLVGGGKYIVGSVTVEVSGDEVVVNYSYKGTPYDTARPESEYLNLLPDLASLTSVEPEDLGEGFEFGKPISIENDLGGDTHVLLFVRNTLTFRDFWRQDKSLARYWPNSSNYADYYEYLRSIMD